MTTNNPGRPVLVTTTHKGVFFGYYPRGKPLDATVVTIKKAKMAVSWSTDMKGVLGLAATGPSKSCRIGPEVPSITLQDVTTIVECTDEAVTKWDASPWNM